MQNLGDADLCREITVRLEHAFSDQRADWRVSITGSRASSNWEMRVKGPNGFEPILQPFTEEAGEHEPETIRRLIAQLLPAGAM